MRRILLLALVSSGCGVQTREARAIQPDLSAARSVDVAPVSVKLYVHQRDETSQLPRFYQLRSWAQYAVVSRDRLRFHVGISRAEEDEAKTSGWKAWLEDDTGRKLQPSTVELPRVNRLALNWAMPPYLPVDTEQDKCEVPPCVYRIVPGYTAYEGEADYVFSDPGLAHRPKLSLVLERRGMRLRFTWRTGDHTQVENYGRSLSDKEIGTVLVPGPHTELAATRYEGEDW